MSTANNNSRKPKEVATSTPTAFDALNIVRERIKAIKLISDAPPRTNGVFKYSPTQSSSIRISDITSVPELLNILGFLMDKETAYNKAAEVCQLKEYPVFTWCGYSLADWTHDIKVRVAIINHHTNLAELASFERELMGVLSQADKLQLVLTKMGLQ